jgi:MFS family permease
MISPAPFKPTPTHVRFGVLAFACTLSLVTYLDRVCISQVQGEIQRELDLSDRQLGLVFSAFLLGYMIFEVPGGWMGDRWGPRRVLSRIVVWWSLFTALTGSVWYFHLEKQIPVNFLGLSFTITLVFNSFLLLMMIRFLFGCGEAGAYPNLARVVGNWFPYQERAFAQGTIWMMARMGGALAPPAIAHLSDLVGWRTAFWYLGLVGVVWAIFFRLRYHDRPEDHPDCNEAERDLIRMGLQHKPAQEHGSIPWLKMFQSGNLWAVCLAAIGVNLAWYFFPTWQPKYFLDVFDIDFKDSIYLTALPWVCGATGCLLGGRLSDWMVSRTGSRRWGRSLIGLVGFAGAGMCVFAAGFAREAWLAVTLLCMAFFINDVAIPVIWAVSTDIGGRHAGAVGGYMNMMGGFGAILSPALTPVLKDELPADLSKAMRWQIIFSVYAAAWVLAALAWLWIDASKPLFRDSEH